MVVAAISNGIRASPRAGQRMNLVVDVKTRPHVSFHRCLTDRTICRRKLRTVYVSGERFLVAAELLRHESNSYGNIACLSATTSMLSFRCEHTCTHISFGHWTAVVCGIWKWYSLFHYEKSIVKTINSIKIWAKWHCCRTVTSVGLNIDRYPITILSLAYS